MNLSGPSVIGDPEDQLFDMMQQGAINDSEYNKFVVIHRKDKSGNYSRARMKGINVIKVTQNEKAETGWDYKIVAGEARFRRSPEHGNAMVDMFVDTITNKRKLASCYQNKLFRVLDPDIHKQIKELYFVMLEEQKENNIKYQQGIEEISRKLFPNEGKDGNPLTMDDLHNEYFATTEDEDRKKIHKKMQRFADLTCEFTMALRAEEARKKEEAENTKLASSSRLV